MSEPNRKPGRAGRGVFWAAIVGVIVYLVARNIGVLSNVAVVLLGFGAVVLVHEFGHFIVAKLVGIKVEAFSIFMPPMLLGVRRTEQGIKFRFLPGLFGKKEEKTDDGSPSSPAGQEDKASDTEYRVGLIPFGGFVKLLGQEDVGPVKAISDPRSFANKPVGARMAVIAAGVTFNVISAAIIFMMVFLVGIKLPPAVVGDVMPDSPAAKAGLEAGDEIIEINGKSKDLDFSNILLAAALSDVNQVIAVKVRRDDGVERFFLLTAEMLPGGTIREFGVFEPASLTVAHVSDANELFRRTGLLPGDRIKSVNGRDVRTHWELAEAVRDTLLPEVTVGVERIGEGTTKTVESRIRLEAAHAVREVKTEADLSNVYSMVPRLRITDVAVDIITGQSRKPSLMRRLAKKLGVGSEPADSKDSEPKPKLQVDDVVVAVGGIENPTYKELRDITQAHENKILSVTVLRTEPNGVEKMVTVTVEPRRSPGSDRAMIGIGLALDCAHTVVAKTIDVKGGPAKLEIPRGARITAVDGNTVSSFYDCISELRRSAGRHVTISYETDRQETGSVAADVASDERFINVKSSLTESLPFKPLQKLYRAQGPVEALEMGHRRTVMFIGQAYVTLRRLIGGLISPKQLMGPVGIMTLSYRIVAEQPFIYYAYFLGLINATIAVFNFLPMPPFDGGLIVLMLIEKVKGSALSEKAQGLIAYTGWALVGTLLLYVTFNDIVRSFFS